MLILSILMILFITSLGKKFIENQLPLLQNLNETKQLIFRSSRP